MVAGSSSYKGWHSGRTGTVKYVYEKKRADSNIAVTLDDINNDASSKGWFYFKESDLRVFYGVKVDNLQKTSIGIPFDLGIGICHIGSAPLSGVGAITSEIATKMNEKGDNRDMKSEKILELWKKAGMESIEAKMAREEEDLLAGDPACAQLRGCVAEIDRIISESRNDESKFSNNFDCERFASDATTQKISEARSKMMDKKKDLNCFVEEIAAMLSACETYVQEMYVLRTYGVIEEDGRLNKFFAL